MAPGELKLEERSDSSDAFTPQEGDEHLEQRMQMLSTRLNDAMATRNTSAIRDLMRQRNSVQQRKKIVDQHHKDA